MLNINNNWIKLYSKFINWEWYKNQNTKDLFIHCLIKANWKDAKFEGVDVKRGSFVTSYQTLSEELGISKQSIRTALKHLISTQDITQEQYSKFSIITVTNYDNYQTLNTLTNTELTQEQHTFNTELTPIVEYKNIEYKNIDNLSISFNIYSFVEQNFGRCLSSIEIEKIKFWKDEFDDEIIKEAVSIAVMNRKCNCAYVNAILNDWKSKGLLSILEIQEEIQKFSKRKESKPLTDVEKEILDYNWLEDDSSS